MRLRVLRFSGLWLQKCFFKGLHVMIYVIRLFFLLYYKITENCEKKSQFPSNRLFFPPKQLKPKDTQIAVI